MTKNSNLRIGLFDSGVGGLTVLRQIYRQMPQESILYFGDTARLPYGTKSPEEILQYVREIIDWMIAQGVKMVIMACNTSSALALETVQDEYDIPILGLILPGARAAVQQGKRIGVIATPATASSNAYGRAIEEVNPTVKVWQVGCPEFVMLIEQNQIDSASTKEVADKYLQPLIEQKIDTLIYGCTHYRHLEKVFQSILPPSISIIDPAEYIVVAAEKELELMGLKSNQAPAPTRFCVSGLTQQFAFLSEQWLGFLPSVEQVQIDEQLIAINEL
ncbi:glutamate racemase [Hyella patelloides]|nr:glutamate racemase [Hyella patelloides]